VEVGSPFPYSVILPDHTPGNLTEVRGKGRGIPTHISSFLTCLAQVLVVAVVAVPQPVQPHLPVQRLPPVPLWPTPPHPLPWVLPAAVCVFFPRPWRPLVPAFLPPHPPPSIAPAPVLHPLTPPFTNPPLPSAFLPGIPPSSPFPPSLLLAMLQMASGLMGTVVQGFAMGTGSAIAHRAVGAVFGSMGGGSSAPAPAGEAPVAAAPAAANSKCDTHNVEFVRCVKENKHDIASCQMLVTPPFFPVPRGAYFVSSVV